PISSLKIRGILSGSVWACCSNSADLSTDGTAVGGAFGSAAACCGGGVLVAPPPIISLRAALAAPISLRLVCALSGNAPIATAHATRAARITKHRTLHKYIR